MKLRQAEETPPHQQETRPDWLLTYRERFPDPRSDKLSDQQLAGSGAGDGESESTNLL